VEVDLKPGASEILPGVDRPAVGDLVQEDVVVVRPTWLGWHKQKLAACAELDAHHVGAQPDAQLRGLGKAGRALPHGARHQLAREQHDGFAYVLRGVGKEIAHVIAGRARGVWTELK
jgi:hypothetical protein